MKNLLYILMLFSLSSVLKADEIDNKQNISLKTDEIDNTQTTSDSILEKCNLYFRLGPSSDAAFPVTINPAMGVGVRFREGYHGLDLSGELGISDEKNKDEYHGLDLSEELETSDEKSFVDLKAGYILFASDEIGRTSSPFIGLGMKVGVNIDGFLPASLRKVQFVLTPGFQFSTPSGNTHFIQLDLPQELLKTNPEDSNWGLSYGWLY